LNPKLILSNQILRQEKDKQEEANMLNKNTIYELIEHDADFKGELYGFLDAGI
jgi:hypothetical protein